MSTFWRNFAACMLLLSIAMARADAPAQSGTSVGIEEVMVTGEHPGPGLWRVSSGEHVLFILGTHEPLPRELTWRSEEVEFAVTEAQQIIGNYSASFSLRNGSAYGTQGKALRKILPRKTYEQWQADADKNAAYLYASSWPFLQDDELHEIFAEADRRWIDAATRALERNRTTIAVLPVFQLLREDGLLKLLRDKGFTVEAPLF